MSCEILYFREVKSGKSYTVPYVCVLDSVGRCTHWQTLFGQATQPLWIGEFLQGRPFRVPVNELPGAVMHM